MTDAINVPQQLAILGSTGSVGVSTLDVVARHRGRFNVVALRAYRQLDLLLRAVPAIRPALCRITRSGRRCSDCSAVCKRKAAHRGTAWCAGLEQIAALPQVDTVMAAIVGAPGCARRSPRRRPASACCSRTRKRWSWRARVHAGGARAWRHAAADRQRAQRGLPGAAARFRRRPRGSPACGASC